MITKNDIEFIKKLYFDDMVGIYALKNAVEHNGVVNEKSVYNSIMGHFNKQQSKEHFENWVEERLPLILDKIIK